MNILVTGANGQLGSHIRLQASSGSCNQWFFTDVDTLDITNQRAVECFVVDHSIDCVVNCAAYTNVDAAEDDEAAADRVNHRAVAILAAAMKQHDGLLVHISTDYVFGGNLCNTPCTEETQVNPLGVYGRTKLAGEQAIVEAGCRHIILRTSWLYGEYGRNFLKTMLSLMHTRDALAVVYDQTGTPTYAGDLAKTILNILENRKFEKHYGIYNFSNEGVCSWFDFAQAIARLSEAVCDIRPCLSSEYPSKVVRPSYSVLDKTKIKNTFGIVIPYWEHSLEKCINNIQLSSNQ